MGGGNYLKAYASVAYDKDNGILQNTYSNSLGSKINLDFKLNNYISINETVTFQYKNGQGNIGTGHNGILSYATMFPRSATLYDTDKDGNILYDALGNKKYMGTVPSWAAKQGLGGSYGELRNPLAALYRLDQLRPSIKLYSTTSFIIKPISNVVIKSDFTTGIKNGIEDMFVPRVPEVGLPKDGNERNINVSRRFNYIWENTISYSNIFADKHHISLMAGYSMKYEKNNWFFFQANNFTKENRYYTILPLAQDFGKQESPKESIVEEGMISSFGRAAYSWDDRYFLTASVRYDATSKLWKNNKSGIFPSVSASWKISSEPFFKNIKNVVNMFKVRASWGQIGNVNLVPLYSWNVPMGVNEYKIIFGKNLDNVITNGVYTKSISVKNLKWETSEQLGFGIDLSLFNNSFTLSADYYNKTTKDLIEKVPISSVAGIEEEPYGNIGKVKNEGFEFSSTYSKTFGGVNVKLYGNLSINHNKVLNLGPRQELIHNNTINGLQPLRSMVGQPWYSFYVIKTNGIFQSQEEIDNYTHTNPNTGERLRIQPYAKPGDLKFIDYNNDGKINDDDRQYIGSYLPTVNYGFGASCTWNGLDFSLSFQGVSGNKIFNGIKYETLAGRGQGGNMIVDVKNSWNFNNKSSIPRLSMVEDSNGNFTTANEFYIEDGGYLRLKNITLGYTLPQSVWSYIGLPKTTARLYFNAENVLTFTKYSGLDPEVGNFGIDAGIYPLARVFSFGFNLNF